MPKPAWQVDVQLPAEQVRVATLVLLQARPQAPQLSTFVESSSSQPSSEAGAAGRLQLPLVPLQEDVHNPALQLSVCTPAVEQVRPHAPQLSVSVEVEVSQPLSAAGAEGVVQSPKPALHTGVQLPPVHTRV